MKPDAPVSEEAIEGDQSQRALGFMGVSEEEERKR